MNTNELTGAALDWAVAKCEVSEYTWGNTPYSTDWAFGGPIIEREGITTVRCNNDYEVDARGYCTNVPIPVWAATTGHHALGRGYDEQEASLSQYESDLVFGPTPLIAAMRCYVLSKLGDTVDIPEEVK